MSTKTPAEFLEELNKLANDFVLGRAEHRNCYVCFNFDGQAEVCRLANVRPPARTIAYGCPAFELDSIPF